MKFGITFSASQCLHHASCNKYLPALDPKGWVQVEAESLTEATDQVKSVFGCMYRTIQEERYLLSLQYHFTSGRLFSLTPKTSEGTSK